MLIYDKCKINRVEFVRVMSDKGFYIRKADSKELVNEILYRENEPIKVVETDIVIENTEAEKEMAEITDKLELKRRVKHG